MFFDKVLTKIFGTSNERAIKKLTPFVAQINALEAEIKPLTDEQLRAKTDEFRARMEAKRVYHPTLVASSSGIRLPGPGSWRGTPSPHWAGGPSTRRPRSASS